MTSRTRWLAGALPVTLLGGLLGTAAAEPVAVKVIDVAGELTYVEPGEAAGLRTGTRVTVGTASFVVVEVNAKTAALRPDTGQQAGATIGSTGTADVTPRPVPRPAEAFREQWPAVVPPVRSGDAASGKRAGMLRTHVTVIGSGYAAVGSDHVRRASAEARVIASFDNLAGRPLGLDLDIAARGYSVGWNREENEPVFVRAAQLRYGDTLVVGRLRYAAATLGMLDGARVATRVGSFELAAFGGLVPDPLSGEPDTASRFGTELAFDGAALDWQPRISATAYGSTFDGKLDERRLSLAGSAGRGGVWFDSWLEAQQFAKDNPFGASSVELTGAGASTAWRARTVHAGFGVTFLRPERSLRLASVLPDDWLCARNAADACAGGDSWLIATASAGVRSGDLSLDAVVTGATTHGRYVGGQSDPLAIGTAREGSLYVRGELRRSDLRFFVAPAAGRTSFATWAAVDLGAGIVAGRIDASLAYRPESLDERVAPRTTLHSAVAELRAAVSPTVQLALSTLATLGDDRNALIALGTFVWRAR